MELYLSAMLRQVDSSLEDEWERMRDPNYSPLRASGAGARGMGMKPPGAEEALRDITRDAKAFTAAVRTAAFTFLRAWAIGDHAAAVGTLESMGDLAKPPVGGPQTEGEGSSAPAGEAARRPWTAERLRDLLEAYRVDHERLRLDPEARNARHTHVSPSDEGLTWRVQQMLVDPEMHNDWVAEFRVDLPASRTAERPVLGLVHLGPLA